MGFAEQRFTSTVDEEFRCPICRDIVDEPTTCQCEHVFCKECIHQWIAREPSCPVDRQTLKDHHLVDVSRIYKNFYSKLSLKCEFEYNGCDAICSVQSVKEHQNKCEFNPNIKTECNNGCKAMVTKSESSSHNCVQYLMAIIDEKSDHIRKMTERENEYKRKLLDLQITIKTKNSEINHLNECLFAKQNQTSDNRNGVIPLVRPASETMSAYTSNSNVQKFKLLVMGDKGVGKSSLVMRFINNSYSESGIAAIDGYRSRTIELNEQIIDLQIWENSRQFNIYIDFREVDGIIFVYDVTHWKTFKNISNLIKDMKHKTKTKVKRLIVGNKCDDIENKCVDYLSALKLARFTGIPFIETSAKTGNDVEEAFYRVVSQSVINLSDFRHNL